MVPRKTDELNHGTFVKWVSEIPVETCHIELLSLSATNALSESEFQASSVNHIARGKKRKKTISKEQLGQIATETIKYGILIRIGTPSELALMLTPDI